MPSRYTPLCDTYSELGCSNCLPRTLGSESRRAKRLLNVATAGMLIEGYDVLWRSGAALQRGRTTRRSAKQQWASGAYD
jgi:hypothetical protein